MGALVRLSAENSAINIRKQKKRQQTLFLVMLTEGIAAIVAGVLTLTLARALPIGIVLIVLGVFVTVAVGVMNVRTVKKLNALLARAESYLQDGANCGNAEASKKDEDREEKPITAAAPSSPDGEPR